MGLLPKALLILVPLVAFFSGHVIILAAVCAVSLLLLWFGVAERSLQTGALIYILLFLVFLVAYGIVIEPSVKGLFRIGTTALRLSALALGTVAAFSVISTVETSQMARALRLPRGVALAIGTGLRFIPTSFTEIEAVLLAQRARGLGGRGRLRLILSLPTVVRAISIPVVVRIVRRTTDFWIAIRVRGVSPVDTPPGSLLSCRGTDLACVGYALAVIAAAVILPLT